MKKKIMFVCPRYGTEVNGGAEAECRAYAEKLVKDNFVLVVTTCAIDYLNWRNEYAPGICEINGVKVMRFHTRRTRDRIKFNMMSESVYAAGHSDTAEQKWIDEQGPYCPEAIHYVRQESKIYDVVFFIPYLYYTTARVLTSEIKNAVLIPAAHDEKPVYLRCYDSVFRNAKGIVYNTYEEKEFVEKRFPCVKEKPNCTVGYGIDVLEEKDTSNVKQKYRLEDYILYAGRIDESKGCAYLFRYFDRYKRKHPEKLKLVLCGKAAMEIPNREGIVSLGFVSEEDKYGLMKNAKVFVNASQFESLSIVVLESMAMGTAVLVNGTSAVLKGHCLRSNAGLWFNDYLQFEGTLTWLLSHPKERWQMGKNGKLYVNENYRWSIITGKLEEIIDKISL